ncbi:ABC transporter substrate-binding protein [Schlegelella sp. S2-27]|uniref:ABC transporter substrate-binding protein n=1 Tax=Caldimonas mangrovi TaxID=2944811 RepID=A0ABT0YNX4_9BURK|nr:ABC transporter substrate-binding protein [Caldimonas mangrovi]MCM5680435.1 ABC transporter substrate-binding protein [Caldimonas mangrovi]
MGKTTRGIVAWLVGALLGATAWAQGVTGDAVTLVQTADLSGSRASLVKELNSGWRAFLAQVNERGGVHGRRVDLVTEDDKYEIEETRRIVRERLQRNDAFAFVSLIGTANAAAVLPLLEGAGVPVVAPFSGAEQLRDPQYRWVFHLRASYAQEVEKMVEHVLTLGMRRIAVFYDDDAFGQDVLKAAEAALTRRHLAPVARGRVDRGSVDVARAVSAIAASDAQVVICGSFGNSLVEFVRGMKQSGKSPSYYALSFFPAGASIRQLAGDARGIGVTQVMPKPSAMGLALVREFHAAMRRHAPGDAPSAIALEGYATAKVTVEALRRAGPALTRPGFVTAMETMTDFDLGGVRLNYRKGDHTGLKFVEISVVDEGGRLMH